jgi:small-conductance mechanosensitive channel
MKIRIGNLNLNKAILILTILFLILLASIPFLPNDMKIYATRGLLSLAVITFFLLINSYIIKSLDRLNLPYSKNFSNLLHVLAFLIAALVILKIWNVDTSIILQSSVVLGLVLGLALQPILSNLFAGIIILSTRYVEVGKKIKILSSQIPYGLVPLPPYKFLSVENTDLGYKGSIKKVTLFYSVFQLEEGEEIKIPNAVLLNSVILDRDKENAIISVRVEFPLKLKIGLEKLEDEIKRSLKGFNIVEGPYFNEQSDKEHVFITLKVENKDNWKRTKSEVLKRLLILKEKLKKKR